MPSCRVVNCREAVYGAHADARVDVILERSHAVIDVVSRREIADVERVAVSCKFEGCARSHGVSGTKVECAFAHRNGSAAEGNSTRNRSTRLGEVDITGHFKVEVTARRVVSHQADFAARARGQVEAVFGCAVGRYPPVGRNTSARADAIPRSSPRVTGLV